MRIAGHDTTADARAGDTFISPRSARQPLTSSFSVFMRAFAASSTRSKFAFGKGCSEIDSPVLPASGATVCHSSSVMNGMKGCASRSVASSSRTRTERVPRAAAASPFASAAASCTLASSRYQSQNSSQTNS